MALDTSSIRRQFPLFTNRKGLAYLDSAATTQKPEAVLDAMDTFYRTSNANPHRGMHILAEEATAAYEKARKAVQVFLHASAPEEIIFTKNATEAINLAAYGMRQNLREGDAIILTVLEHHSNVIPWMHVAKEKNLEIRWIDIDDKGFLMTDELDAHLADGKAKIVAVTGLSNVLGTKPDLDAIVQKSHAAGAFVLVDATQLAVHDVIDVQKIDCDFLVCSGHKLYGPTGIGVLYAKKKILETMAPLMQGSMMIGDVTMQGFSLADIPMRFEAGTQPVAEAVGFAAAIEWLAQFPIEDRKVHERLLLETALKTLSSIEGVTVLGPKNANEISGCISFTADGIHPHDLTDILGKNGFCLRAGHHCAQPLHDRLKIPASARLSVGIYNTAEEIERLGPAIREIIKKFRS